MVFITILSRTEPRHLEAEAAGLGFGRGESQLIRKAISALEGAGFASAICECRFYHSPFPGSPRNEGRLWLPGGSRSRPRPSSAARHASHVHVRVHTECRSQRASRRKPHSCNSRLRPAACPSIPTSVSSRTAICLLLGMAFWTSPLHCLRVVDEVLRMAWRFAVALPTASNSTGRFQMQQRRIADGLRHLQPMLIHQD